MDKVFSCRSSKAAELAHEASKKKYIDSIEELEKLISKTKEASDVLVKDKDEALVREKEALKLVDDLKAEVERQKMEKGDLLKDIEALFSFKQFTLTELISHHVRNCVTMKAVMAGVNNAMNGIGFNAGVRAGYTTASNGVPMNATPKLVPNAKHMLFEVVKCYDEVAIPSISTLQDLVSEPLDVVIQAFKQLSVIDDSAQGLVK